MTKLADSINRNADHIIVWKDENGWHTENWGNQNLLPLYGDITDALINGQAAKDSDHKHEYYLVEVKFVHNFRATSSVI